MKKLFAFSRIKYLLFAVIVIAVLMVNMQSIPKQFDSDVTDKTMIEKKSQSSVIYEHAQVNQALLDVGKSEYIPYVKMDGDMEPVAAM